MPSKKKMFMCVCKTNTCRSPMFAALLRQALDEAGIQAIVESAGTHHTSAGGLPAHKMAIKALEPAGVGLSDHSSRFISNKDMSRYDLVLCMDSESVNAVLGTNIKNPKVVVLVNESEGGIRSPNGQDQNAFDACAEKIGQVVKGLVGLVEA